MTESLTVRVFTTDEFKAQIRVLKMTLLPQISEPLSRISKQVKRFLEISADRKLTQTDFRYGRLRQRSSFCAMKSGVLGIGGHGGLFFVVDLKGLMQFYFVEASPTESSGFCCSVGVGYEDDFGVVGES